MVDIKEILQALTHAGVDFIIIGGVAATIHGSARLTSDLDLLYRRSPENQRKIAETLKPFSPYPRGAPDGLPFHWDEKTIAMGLNFTLLTSFGAVDLLGEIAGGGSYDNLLPFTDEVEFLGINCRCIRLDKLIEVKHAAGRPKDFEAIAELEALREEKEKKK